MTDPALPDVSQHPLNVMDTSSIETAAVAIEALGKTVGDNGAQAVTSWAPISTGYQGPGDAELIALMAPVGTMSSSLKDRTASVAASLRRFKDTADEIKASMTTLKADLVTLRSDVAAWEAPTPYYDEYGRSMTPLDWWDDTVLESENERIIKGLNDAVERMHEAERVCINEIRALHCLAALTAGDGGYENGEYGIESIPHEAATPWGTAVPDDENCGEAAVSWVGGALADLVGLVGMQWDEDGNFSWTLDNFTETWAGMGALISYNAETGEWGDWGHAGETWTAVGQDFLSWERWAENPEGALTDVVLNVGSLFLGGAGALAKVAKVGKVGRAARRGDADVHVDVDIDAGDLDIPALKPHLDIDFDIHRLDLDVDRPNVDVDRPDVDRPDVPANGPEAPDDRPDSPADRPDADSDRPDADSDASSAAGDDAPRPDQPTVTDPRVAERTLNTEVDFQASPDFDRAVDARGDAVDARRDALAERTAAIAELDELGIHVEPSTLTKAQIDPTVDLLIARTRADASLTPDEIAVRVDALDELREVALAERQSFVDQVQASEAMGDAAARDAIRSQDAEVVVDGAGAGRGQFDQVGLSDDGRTLIVAEAKGGSANLSTTGRELADGSRAAQGSTLYFNEIFRIDPSLQQYLADNPRIAQGLNDGSIDIRYQLVRADARGVVRVEDLAIDPSALDLTVPVPR